MAAAHRQDQRHETKQRARAHWKKIRDAVSTINKLPDAKEICAIVPKSSREWVTGAVPSAMAWLADFVRCWGIKRRLAAAVQGHSRGARTK